MLIAVVRIRYSLDYIVSAFIAVCEKGSVLSANNVRKGGMYVIRKSFISGVFCLIGICFVGCSVQDSLIKMGQSGGNTAPVVTISGDVFMRMTGKPPAYPEVNTYEGLKGNFHYLYHFTDSALRGTSSLKTIYRAHKSEIPKGFAIAPSNRTKPSKKKPRVSKKRDTTFDRPRSEDHIDQTF